MPKILKGKIISDKMEKTLVVKTETRRPHPRYGKMVKHSRKYKVHYLGEGLKTGDSVKFMETRPLSKGKKWRVVE